MTQRLISRKEINDNLIIYCLFILIVTVGIFYGNAIKTSHLFLRIWNYENLLLLFVGIPFLFFQSNASLPNFLEVGISNKQRLLKPILIGSVFGLLDIL